MQNKTFSILDRCKGKHKILFFCLFCSLGKKKVPESEISVWVHDTNYNISGESLVEFEVS